MALFWSKKPKAEKNYEQGAQVAKTASSKGAKNVKGKTARTAKAVKTTAAPAVAGELVSSVESIIRPHVTEKSGIQSQNGVYTFQISAGANKSVVANAVKTLYKVTPTKVAIVNLPAKNVFVRGKKGVVGGVRKAIVTVKKGEKIDFV